MNEKTTAIGVLAIVAVIALCGCALLYKGATADAIYEQPANNKPLFIQTSNYLEGFDMCSQYACPAEDAGGIYFERMPASIVAYDTWTGNIICECPNGFTFNARGDRIEVETY
jgi:hypothetical protein